MTEVVEHGSLAAAFVAAQAEMPAVEPDAVNPHFRSKFVSLGHLVAKARPVLNRHGIGVAQFPSADEHGKPTLVTVLIHGKSGEQMAYPAPLMLSKADPQGQGSAITYMRRYALAAALGIVDQEDDDGNAATAAAGSATANGGDPPAAPPRPVLDEKRAAHIVSSLRELTEGGQWDSQRVRTALVAAGALDTSSVTAAVSSLEPGGAAELEKEVWAAIDARDETLARAAKP